MRMPRRSIAIEQAIRSRSFWVPKSRAHSILKTNLRISFSSRFEFLSFRTAWVTSRHFGKAAQCLLSPRADIRCDGFDSGCFRFFTFTPIGSPRSPLRLLT